MTEVDDGYEANDYHRLLCDGPCYIFSLCMNMQVYQSSWLYLGTLERK